MNKMERERERSEIESKWISVTGQQPRHAFVTGGHDVAYHLLVNLPPELPSIRSNLFFPDRPGSAEKCVLCHFFTLKRKRGKTTAGAGR